MERLLVFILGVTLCSFQVPALAAWEDISNGLDERDIRTLAVDPNDPRSIFAASDQHVFKAQAGKNAWKRVLGLQDPENHITCLLVHPLESKRVYAATTRGVWGSQDAGESWQNVYDGVGETKKVFSLAVDPENGGVLWVGTARGIFQIDVKDKHVRKVEGSPDVGIYSIYFSTQAKPKADASIIILTDNGIYKRSGNSGFWQRVYADPTQGTENPQDLASNQTGAEEISTQPFLSNIAFSPSQNKYYVATPRGLIESGPDASSWSPTDNQNLPDKKINSVAVSSDTFFTATDRGIFQRDTVTNSFKELYEGLDSKEARALAYSVNGDTLFAATAQGVFKLLSPGLSALRATDTGVRPAKQVLESFQNEPSIQEIQEAAVEYAEVNPKKIEAWRTAASRKALLPTVSIDRSLSRHENVDIDRGGTADPDRFITGPKEASYGWSVGANWNLGELVWNEDQTSIDSRSKLMVELRDDVLNEVTHLYYERRRLQVEICMSPEKEPALQILRQIRLEELTAGIDGLTGGYLSKHLGVNLKTNR